MAAPSAFFSILGSSFKYARAIKIAAELGENFGEIPAYLSKLGRMKKGGIWAHHFGLSSLFSRASSFTPPGKEEFLSKPVESVALRVLSPTLEFYSPCEKKLAESTPREFPGLGMGKCKRKHFRTFPLLGSPVDARWSGFFRSIWLSRSTAHYLETESLLSLHFFTKECQNRQEN